MKSRDDSTFRVLVITSAITLLPLAAYVFAYFACTTSMGTVRDTGGSCRVYRSPGQAIVFLPASAIESAATGRKITTAWTSP